MITARQYGGSREGSNLHAYIKERRMWNSSFKTRKGPEHLIPHVLQSGKQDPFQPIAGQLSESVVPSHFEIPYTDKEGIREVPR
jgi:hypothetical protein